MNILITGAKGNLGKYLSTYFSLDNNVSAFGKDLLDITDKNMCLNIISTIKPDIVINCAGLTNMDSCELNEKDSYSINTLGSLNLAFCCNHFDIPLLYLSTNYVYGNYKNTPYEEKNECNPINVYGKTKLAGENLIRTLCNKYFIIRTSWVFGGENCILKKIINNPTIPIIFCSDEFTNATYIEDLAYAIKTMLKSHDYGIYNCVNKDSSSKYNMVKTALDLLDIHKDLIKLPTNYINNSAPRANYSVMDTNLFRNTFNIEMPSWKQSLEQYLCKI